MPPLVLCTLGDLLLDVIVRLKQPLEPGTDAAAQTRAGVGGQAANVAAWAAALGAEARFVGKRGEDPAAALVAGELGRLGVEVFGPVALGRNGVVVSLVGEDGERSAFPAVEVEVVDTTGAGDAFAAGYLVGGVELALQTAARCVSQLGATP